MVRQEMEEQRRLQAASIDSLDTKIGIIIGFAGVIVAIYTDKFAFELDSLYDLIISFIGLFFLLFSLSYSVYAYWVRGFRFDPSPMVLKDDYMFRNPDDWNEGKPSSKEQMLADQVEAYNHNQKTLDQKARLINLSAVFLGFGILILLINKLLKGGV